MSRDQYAQVPKARTGTDKRLDVTRFLSMARPDMVAHETAETLAVRYGVPVKVAQEEMRRAGLL